jgi:hypothetical protein
VSSTVAEPAKSLLTARQLKRMAKLPEGHELVSVRGRATVVRRPDGQLMRIRPSGRLVVTNPVKMVQPYLHVHG